MTWSGFNDLCSLMRSGAGTGLGLLSMWTICSANFMKHERDASGIQCGSLLTCEDHGCGAGVKRDCQRDSRLWSSVLKRISNPWETATVCTSCQTGSPLWMGGKSEQQDPQANRFHWQVPVRAESRRCELVHRLYVASGDV